MDIKVPLTDLVALTSTVTLHCCVDCEEDVSCLTPSEEYTSQIVSLPKGWIASASPRGVHDGSVPLQTGLLHFRARPKKKVLDIPCVIVEDSVVAVASAADAHGGGNKSRVVQISLLPRITLLENEIPLVECILLVDRSGSMSGAKIRSACEAAQLLLRSLPGEGSFFNVVSFGTGSSAIFEDGSAPYNAENFQKASSMIDSFRADMGGTDLLKALRVVLQSKSIAGVPRQVIVITDGEIPPSEARQLLNQVECSSHVRIFAIGVGKEADASLVERLGQTGRGASEMVRDPQDLAPAIGRLLSRVCEPTWGDIRVDWGSLKPLLQSQTPAQCRSLFSGHRLDCFGILATGHEAIGNNQVHRIVIHACIAGSAHREQQYEVCVDLSQSVMGSQAHRLAAASRVNDVVLGEVKDPLERAHAIEMACRFGVTTPLTNLVGVASQPATASTSFPSAPLVFVDQAAGYAERHQMIADALPRGIKLGKMPATGRNEQASDGQVTPAMLLECARRNDVKGMERLMNLGVPVDYRDPVTGDTPLMVACEAGQRQAMFYLTEQGAAVNAKNATGSTPLHALVKSHRENLAVWLIKHGADIYQEDNRTSSAFDMAPAWFQKDMKKVAADVNITKRYEVCEVTQTTYSVAPRTTKAAAAGTPIKVFLSSNDSRCLTLFVEPDWTVEALIATVLAKLGLSANSIHHFDLMERIKDRETKLERGVLVLGAKSRWPIIVGPPTEAALCRFVLVVRGDAPEAVQEDFVAESASCLVDKVPDSSLLTIYLTSTKSRKLDGIQRGATVQRVLALLGDALALAPSDVALMRLVVKGRSGHEERELRSDELILESVATVPGSRVFCHVLNDSLMARVGESFSSSVLRAYDLIRMQGFDGCWVSDSASFASVCGIDPWICEENTDPKWQTALAIALLECKCAKEHEIWSLPVAKAKRQISQSSLINIAKEKVKE